MGDPSVIEGSYLSISEFRDLLRSLQVTQDVLVFLFN